MKGAKLKLKVVSTVVVLGFGRTSGLLALAAGVIAIFVTRRRYTRQNANL